MIPFGDARALRGAITPNTCAFLFEPIQGEAGIINPRGGFLREAGAGCRENHVLPMADEIQSGLGRTGKLLAYMHEAVTPDVLIIGKALAGGFCPVSAVLASHEILVCSIFGRNPMGCAIARTALRVLIEEKMVECSTELGAYFLTLLQILRSSDLKQVRGRGLWIGIEMHSPARPYCEALKEEGILCKETHDRGDSYRTKRRANSRVADLVLPLAIKKQLKDRVKEVSLKNLRPKQPRSSELEIVDYAGSPSNVNGCGGRICSPVAH